MPAEVIEFPVRHVTGPARCTSCRHEWVGVSPFDNRFDPLECQSCGRGCGFYVNHYAPIGETVRECSCGNDIFYCVVDEKAGQFAIYGVNCGSSEVLP